MTKGDEDTLSAGIRMEEMGDGTYDYVFEKSPGVAPELIARVVAEGGGGIRYLDGKRKRAVAWFPGAVTAEHIARNDELRSLIDKINDRFKCGEISHAAAKDIYELIAWLGKDTARQKDDRCKAILAAARMATAMESSLRRKGGRIRAANSPKRAAKDEAIKLWPESHRKGWTAERLWTALADRGHKVPPDTVRKWLTKLRNTGTC